MNPRRSLSQALQARSLDERAQAFVAAGQPAPVPPGSPPESVQPAPVPPGDLSPPARTARNPVATDAGEPLVSLSVRVPRALPSGLLLAAVDRKLKRARPCTQQDIVSEALTLWLKQHGYLTGTTREEL